MSDERQTQGAKEPRLIRPRRSVLFVPGSNARALEKARGLDADVVALDLEDAVAPQDKAAARSAVCAAIAARAFGKKEVAVRINALSCAHGSADLAAIIAAKPDAVILPKVGDAGEIAQAVHAAWPVPVWAMIETPAGVLNAAAIAAAGTECLILGSNDLLKDMRARPMASRENLWAAMSAIVLAARAAGIGVMDGTFNDLDDDAGLMAACQQGRSFGFDGKTVIHPRQIAAANRAFAPSEEEIASAHAVVNAFAQNRDKAVLALHGRMVERLHAEEAARLIALAEAIDAKC